MLDEIFESLQILERRCESIASVRGMSQQNNRFSRAILALERLGLEHQMPIAIVGGLGAIRYGYAAATDDIDIVVAECDSDRILELAPTFGFKILWRGKSGWHTLTMGDVEINIVPAGGRARDTSPTKIPSPSALGVEAGIGYAALPGWMELKISSGRQKDFGHIVEVIKRLEDSTVELVRHHLSAVHTDYRVTFDRLVQQAAEEQQQERRRE